MNAHIFNSCTVYFAQRKIIFYCCCETFTAYYVWEISTNFSMRWAPAHGHSQRQVHTWEPVFWKRHSEKVKKKCIDNKISFGLSGYKLTRQPIINTIDDLYQSTSLILLPAGAEVFVRMSRQPSNHESRARDDVQPGRNNANVSMIYIS